ncbi:MAG: phage holin family protein [Bacteroidetes bacterium]|nr:phage holin family protein [Bacteroidota bacterium]MCL2302902.1 phage holin family protein [Lentimicrobiaceae bacterium]
MLKNIYEIIGGNSDGLYIELSLIVGCWMLMIFAVLIDLWTGIERAKKCGERLKSNKFRRTLSKISEYWRVMLFGLFIDIILFVILPYHVPFGSIIFTLACCSIEAKSVIENLKLKKSAAANVPGEVLKILKHLDNPDKLKSYIDMLNQLNNKQDDE